MTTPRLAAARVLVAVERGRTTLAAEMEHARRGVESSRDRGLLFAIAAGTLRWRGELDALLGGCSRRPLAELEADVRAILRLGAYQLHHLTRVPPHAIVHESVEVARAMGHARATGFINAVLRSLARRRNAIALPPRPGPGSSRGEMLAYLTTTLSHPEWLASRWLDRYGFEAAELWCQFNNEPPEISTRAPGPSEASELVAHAVGAAVGERILDLCASPGGKTTILFQDMGGDGLLVASDFRPNRVALLSATVRRAGIRVPIVRLDARQPLPFDAVFDCVFIDVPCTGLGTLQSNPDIKWARQPADLASYVAVEDQMLANAARAVRAGGRLVYATCSSEPEENELVVDRFIANHRQFHHERGLHTLPYRDRLEAFFAAVLRRNS